MKRFAATLLLLSLTLPLGTLAFAGNPDELDPDLPDLDEVNEEVNEYTEQQRNTEPANTLPICPFTERLDLLPYNSGESDEYSDENTNINLNDVFNNAKIEDELEKAAKNGTSCGKVNPVTGFIEKGDCTKEGKVITEISEVFGPDVEEDANGNSIVSVYKGVCCLYEDDNGGSCVQTRNGYTDSYESCVGTPGKEVLGYCEKRQWVIGKSGAGILKIYVKQLYIWAAATIGFMSLSTMVISGIQISVSGSSGDITASKERIFKALSGLVLLFLSGLILYTINPTFFS